MPNLDNHLKINRCPHCLISNPNLSGLIPEFSTREDNASNLRYWRVYICARCGGVVTAYCNETIRNVVNFYPEIESVDDTLPNKVKTFMQQAIDSTFAPAGSVMLCASAIDAMFKEKGYMEGGLYSRINYAISDGLIPKDMELWAHRVRLYANDQRPSDFSSSLPSVDEAKQTIEFTKALADYLFILPAKVKKGIESSSHKELDLRDITNIDL
ncbi:MAG: hypothetical protein NTW54_12315 [Bacteroidetes bacterium]|nr:hypothetical protein [Bacteroidota bacterium]